MRGYFRNTALFSQEADFAVGVGRFAGLRIPSGPTTNSTFFRIVFVSLFFQKSSWHFLPQTLLSPSTIPHPWVCLPHTAHGRVVTSKEMSASWPTSLFFSLESLVVPTTKDSKPCRLSFLFHFQTPRTEEYLYSYHGCK